MSSKIPLPDALLSVLGRKDYQPLNDRELARQLKLSPQRHKELSSVLHDLELNGRIARVRKDRWILPKEAELVTGVMQFNQKGFAFLIPEDGSEDLYISAEDTATAMHQDLVVARLGKDTFRGRNQETRRTGRVIRILKRRRDQLVGTLEKSGLFHYVVPDDPRFIHDIYVPDPATMADNLGIALGDKVVVKLHDWPSRHVNPEGVLVERLGREGDPGVDILSIIRKHELPMEFPGDVLAEVAKFHHPGTSEDDFKGRHDYTRDFVVTIDPDTAKDFDDAISIRTLKNKNYEVGIHIADVSHYVKPGTALDREAQKRGNSVYLVNQVIPMLPEELSNGLCSLLPNVNRFAHSVIVEMTPRGDVVHSKTVKTVIHSRHRLSYRQAFQRLERPPQDDLDDFLHLAWKLASQLRTRRFKNGALELDFPEVKVHLDANGKPVRLEKVVNDISHQLIEEFMLLANELVAESLKNKHRPALYRVHEAPDPEKLKEYRETLKGYGIKVGDLTRREELQKALRLVDERPERHTLKIGLLRSLKRADYRPVPLGHFGLAKVNYTHFTSPIRRYADLVVHRAINSPKEDRGDLKADNLAKIGKHLSITERIAGDAEEESVRLKKMEYFAAQLNTEEPQSFKAQITDVQNFGLFVELPEFLVSGLVHISTLKDDFYIFDQRTNVITGRKTRRRLAMGDFIEVRVDKIDFHKKQIDFRLVSGPVPAADQENRPAPPTAPARPPEHRAQQDRRSRPDHRGKTDSRQRTNKHRRKPKR